ncbi:MAG: glycoside hydrolase family 127 protein, partial [Chloroflexota bacterium]|nr:glycoside hydrolase family 127 protein [Chloroflexota bacterium]
IGARHAGEAFGENYELPNATAYNETCAAIANIFWNQRLFLLHGDAKYIDVVERTLYNGFLGGVGFSGDLFFYPNPLASDGQSNFNVGEGCTRSPWFKTSCCPTNVVRFLPSLPGYVYAQRGDDVYVNLFLAGEATLTSASHAFHITQQHNYPWDGAIKLTVTPDNPVEFTLCLRIPGWAQNQPVPSDLYQYLDNNPEPVTLTVNGQPIAFASEQGFVRLHRTWQAGDVIELNLPMPVRRVVSHPAVLENREKVAVERGPLVYCGEGIDNGGHVLDAVLHNDAAFNVAFAPELLNGVAVIRATQRTAADLVLIPYYAWSHRGVGEMAVWLGRQG